VGFSIRNANPILLDLAHGTRTVDEKVYCVSWNHCPETRPQTLSIQIQSHLYRLNGNHLFPSLNNIMGNSIRKFNRS
jgi:hypothetical protein